MILTQEDGELLYLKKDIKIMSWFLARSLETLREQLNNQFPKRGKKSDGTIGDTSHKARKSSHNPDAHGAVRAFDVTHDTVNGVDCRKLLKALLKAKDRRLLYLIFEGHIYNVKDGFTKRPYSGKNAHKQHLHISVSDSSRLYNDSSAWDLDFSDSLEPVTSPTTAPAKTFSLLKKGAKGAEVKALQMKLHYLGLLTAAEVDSDFGSITERAVIQYQRSKGLDADGKVGTQTATKLGLI